MRGCCRARRAGAGRKRHVTAFDRARATFFGLPTEASNDSRRVSFTASISCEGRESGQYACDYQTCYLDWIRSHLKSSRWHTVCPRSQWQPLPSAPATAISGWTNQLARLPPALRRGRPDLKPNTHGETQPLRADLARLSMRRCHVEGRQRMCCDHMGCVENELSAANSTRRSCILPNCLAQLAYSTQHTAPTTTSSLVLKPLLNAAFSTPGR